MALRAVGATVSETGGHVQMGWEGSKDKCLFFLAWAALGPTTAWGP